MSVVKTKALAWLALSRPPFHFVGVLPFLLGTLLAWQMEGAFNWSIMIFGILGVVAIMLATYLAGEYWDYAEDSVSLRQGPSRFAGGSHVLQRGLLPRGSALCASMASMVFAVCVGVILQFCYGTGRWTIPLGVLGMLGGFFYSTRPVRWVSRGWGEIWIAFCYGWLPVAVGYYLQAGTVPPLVHWMAIPIGLTIFNVILLNEQPDYQADLVTGKSNLTVRIGRERAAILYGLIGVGSWVAMFISLTRGVPVLVIVFYIPVLALSMVLVTLVMRGHWKNKSTLERLCGANILVNLGTTGAYILAFLG